MTFAHRAVPIAVGSEHGHSRGGFALVAILAAATFAVFLFGMVLRRRMLA